jgi:hypothetical protein
VVGHRWGSQAEIDRELLQERIEIVLGMIESRATTPVSDEMEPEKCRFRLVCGLAEGGDQLASTVALQREWALQVALPFPEDEFVEDFADPDSVKRMRNLLGRADGVVRFNCSRASQRNEGHRTVGEYILRNCELLVSLWDGKPSRGVGGTAWTVERARDLGIPVLWIRLDQADYPAVLDSGSVSPAAAEYSSNWKHALSSALGRALRVAGEAVQQASNVEPGLSSYLREPRKTFNPGFAYPLFQLLFSGRPLRREDFLPTSEASRSPSEHEGPICEHLVRADSQANYYAQVYRSAVVLNYLFAAMAVLMALMGLLIPAWKLLWITIELFLIGAVIVNTYLGQKRDWHQRWLDYRQLAERCRVLELTQSMGSWPSRNPTGDLSTEKVGRAAWVDATIFALSRRIPPSTLHFSDDFISDQRDRFSGYLSEQTSYHDRTAAVSELLNHRLHGVGQICLIGTILACFGFMATHALMDDVPSLVTKTVTFLTAALPAFGASAFGLRAHLDLRGVARRSEAMAGTLRDLETRLSRLPSTPLALMKAADLLGDSHVREVRDWRVIFEDRHLEIPA